MEEILELRINYDYAHLLFGSDEGRDIGDVRKTVKIVNITKDDPRWHKIPLVDKEITQKTGYGFFYGWRILRKYSKKEIESAELFHMRIKITFEPAGEECGTVYDESAACEICGANRGQVGPLKLKQGSIPKKDIARTIAGEVVVSEKFVEAFRRHDLKGASCEQIASDKGSAKAYQLVASSPALELTGNTIAGINPFDLSESNQGEIYKCPRGHTIGLNLLSELNVLTVPSIGKFDFFATRQKIGVKRGLLRPESLYLCSPGFRKMVEEEKLTGFDFEIAHIE